MSAGWTVEQLEAWLREVEPHADKRGKFEWLELPPIASQSAIQDAFHAIARTRHPDLFASRIDARMMDRLVRMYARVTAAYAELRDPQKCAAYLRELRGGRATTVPPPAGPAAGAMTVAGGAGAAPAGVAAVTSTDPAHAMNPRALSFYRRAEGVLRTGDRAAALLQLRMAIAADPKSAFLRAALAELTRS